MISAKQLYKTFISSNSSTEVFSDVSFNTGNGKIILLTGDSGKGKSTLLKMITGIEDFQSGEIEIDGIKMSEQTEQDKVLLLRNKFSIIFQNYNLISSIDVLENLSIPLLLQNNNLNTLDTISELLARLGLENCLHKFPDELSGGQQQRIAIARSIIVDKKYLFADEPTSSLDDGMEKNIVGIFQEMALQGRTVFIASHDKLYQEIADVHLRIENKKIYQL